MPGKQDAKSRGKYKAYCIQEVNLSPCQEKNVDTHVWKGMYAMFYSNLG